MAHDSAMHVDSSSLTPQQAYRILTGSVHPRPIAFVSSVSAQGVFNLAPFSFFNVCGCNPMMLMFCPLTSASAKDKDTLANVLPAEEGGTGEFVVNLAVESYSRQMAATAEPVGPEVDEFQLAGFTAAASECVKAPRVLESPVSFECRTRQVIRTNPGQAMSGNIVLGEVVHIWLADDMVDSEFRIDPSKVPTIGRLGATYYTRTRERFEMTQSVDMLNAPPPFPEDLGTGVDPRR